MRRVLCLVVAACLQQAAAEQRLFVNASIYTGNGSDDFAQAMLLDGERIAGVGSEAALRAKAAATAEVIDLGGRLVLPGFIDSHAHFLSGALALSDVDLRGASNREEFTRRIAEHAKKNPGVWVTRGGWDHESWGGVLPDRNWIDAATGDTPVFVERTDGHMALANSAALRLAGIGDATPQPAGGEILRDDSGRVTGVLKDAAMEIVQKIIPPYSERQIDAALEKGMDVALANGITQVHDMGSKYADALSAFRRVHANGRLRIRIYAFSPIEQSAQLADFIARQGRGDDWLRWGAVKGFVDGSLGSSTAWFHEPYSDDSRNNGMTVVEPAVLARQIRAADAAGLQVAIHAIGDQANDWLLATYRQLPAGGKDRRLRIEHAQHLKPAAISNFSRQHVIASMQPYHAIDDGRWAERRIGAARSREAYVFHSLLAAGVRVAFGSDWDTAPLNALIGIDAAANRRTLDGRTPSGWQPQEKISVMQAVRAYSEAGAFAGFQEDRLGTLAPGYLADFVVLSRNVFEIDVAALDEVVVERTVIAGRDAYVRSYAGSYPAPPPNRSPAREKD